MKTEENKKTKKKNRVHPGIIGAVTLLGCAGTIAFGTLGCHAKKNPDTPTTSFYTITFDLDEGKIEGFTGKSMDVPQGTVYGQLPTPKKDNKNFNVWLVNNKPVNPSEVITDSVTVKATYVDAPTPPTPSDKITWQGNIENDTYWDIGNKNEYESLVEPMDGKQFTSDEEATRAYADAVLNNKSIIANDYMASMIDNILYHQLEAERTLAIYPQSEIDYYYANVPEDGGHHGWTSSNFTGTVDFSLENKNIYGDETHNCLRVSMESFVNVNFSFTLTNPEETESITQYGCYSFDMISKDLPFVITHTDDGLGCSQVPNDFCPEEGGGWFDDPDENGSFEGHPVGYFLGFYYYEGDDFEYTKPIGLLNTFYYFYGLWNKDTIKESPFGPYGTIFVLDYVGSLIADDTEFCKGVNYLQNCTLAE